MAFKKNLIQDSHHHSFHICCPNLVDGEGRKVISLVKPPMSLWDNRMRETLTNSALDLGLGSTSPQPKWPFQGPAR